MLWLVFGARLTAPANQHQQRYTVDSGIGKRGQWIHSVAQARVLHVDQPRIPCTQIMTHSQSDSVALVGSNNVAIAACVVSDIGTDILEDRIRNPSEKRDIAFAQAIVKVTTC